MSSRASIEVHALQLVYADAGMVVGEVGPLCVVIWRGEVNELRFRHQRETLVDVAARYKPNAAIVCIIEDGAPPPSSELRKAGVAVFAALEGQLCSAVMVVEGAGFKAAVTRSVLIGMSALLGKKSFPLHYVGSVAEAASRLPSQLSIAPKLLARDVAELRAIMDSKGSLRTSSERRL